MNSFNIFDSRWPIWDAIKSIGKISEDYRMTLDELPYTKMELVGINEYRELETGVIHPGDRWDEEYTYKFLVDYCVPNECDGKNLYFWFDSPGEGEVYVDGIPFGSLDTAHKEICIYENANAGTQVNIEIIATKHAHDYVRLERFSSVPYLHHILNGAGFCSKNIELLEMKYMCDYLFDKMYVREDSDISDQLLSILENNLLPICFTDERSDVVDALLSAKQKTLNSIKGIAQNVDSSKPTKLNLVSHSHLDLVFKWRWRETVRKIERTLSNTCSLLERFPGSTYVQSQIKILAELKKQYPDLFERTKKLIQNGQIEVVGNTWAEFDANMTSGESIIRQLLYGKEFANEFLGSDNKTMFLPDTFGFSGILPQILKQMGYEYFTTAKLNWNDTNPFPHCVFDWTGIDGSTISSVLFYTYGGDISYFQVAGALASNHGQALNTQLLMFGESDGGGGVSEEMLRKKNAALSVDPSYTLEDSTISQTAAEMYSQVSKMGNVPQVEGEIYLEAHRGTLTSQAKIKKYNRQAEKLLYDLELFSSLSTKMKLSINKKEVVYPAKKIESIWKNVLFNQFHDILPGSSIHDAIGDINELYDATFSQSADVTNDFMYGLVNLDSIYCVDGEVPTGIKAITGKSPEGIAVINSLNWRRDVLCCVPLTQSPYECFDIIYNDQKVNYYINEDFAGIRWIMFVATEVPAFGYAYYRFSENNTNQKKMSKHYLAETLEMDVSSRDCSIENDRYHIDFDAHGDICRLYDKKHNREIIHGLGNKITAYVDKGGYFNAWEINRNHERFSLDFKLVSINKIQDGPLRSTIKIVKQLKTTWVNQFITIYNHTPQIDFKTSVDLNNSELLIKVAFDTGIIADFAQYDLSMGYINRKAEYDETDSIESAKYEVPMHKWQAIMREDLSGVALLNNCKYGGKTAHGTITQTLLKSAIFPDPKQDIGLHDFTYSLLPFEGEEGLDFVTKRAYELNSQPTLLAVSLNRSSNSWLTFLSENAIVQSVKLDEKNNDSLIVRMYEHEGIAKKLLLDAKQFPNYINRTAIEICDPMENTKKRLSPTNGVFEIEFKPFELLTLKFSGQV